GERKAELAAERKPEPEPGAAVAEDAAQVVLVAQATDGVDDPQGPYGEHPGQQELHPRPAGARPPRPTGEQPAAGEGEVAHERVAEGDEKRDVADPQLLAAQGG